MTYNKAEFKYLPTPCLTGFKLSRPVFFSCLLLFGSSFLAAFNLSFFI